MIPRVRQPRFEDESDFVVVGSGAGGATVARVLSAAGHRVLILEEGDWMPQRHRSLLPAFAQNMRNFATQCTRGVPIPLLQGRCVGGSTAVNSGIIWRLPEDVRRQWSSELGLGDLLEAQALDAVFSRMEAELGVETTGDAVLGGNAALMRQASEALGLPGQAMRRNAARCMGHARCLQGCPIKARQSMEVSYIPAAIRAGARLLPRMQIERIVHARRRATGVLGWRLDARGRRLGRVRIAAKRGVVIAAGAVQTPLLLLRSGLRGRVGHGFQAHPGCAVVGRFPEPVRMQSGATQGYEVPLRSRGFKLESLSLPAELVAARLPGFGPSWQKRVADFEHHAQWVVQIRMRARGRVRRGLSGQAWVDYRPTRSDLHTARAAVALLCRMMFAAGAEEVYPGIGGLPAVLHGPSEVERLEVTQLRRSQFRFVASHLFGSAAAGHDPQSSVVGPALESHDLERLYVMDASALPTNLGVNPQHSIMAVAWRAAERLC